MNLKHTAWTMATVLLSTLVVGCVTTTTKNGRQVANPPSRLKKQMHQASASMSGVLARMTPKDDPEPIIWSWAGGIPQSVGKAEEIPVRLTEEVVAALIPAVDDEGIRLVNNTDATVSWSLAAVNDSRIRTMADLHAATETAVQGGPNAVVEIARLDGLRPPVPVQVNSLELASLTHSCLADGAPVRLVEDGNSWIVIKDDGVQCKVMLRREERSGLIHVAMGLKLCWGNPRKLPAAISVRAANRQLSCLSVPETLRILYGQPRSDDDQPIKRFHEIAGEDEYITPVNYRQLEAQLAEDQRLASIRPTPAFAVVGGYAYPGPPVLGDARALSGFLLQPRVYSSEEPEQVGWIIFDGRSVPEAEIFEVDIDLGNGIETVRFKIPRDL